LLLVTSPAFGQEAVQALEDRIRNGDPDAAIALARRLEFGMGVEADLPRAAELYCDAAMRGRAAMPGELPELPVPPELDPHHNLKPSTQDAE
jgi:hypothetical protein